MLRTLRPGADQSSKAAFCKSAFGKCKLTFGKIAFAQSRFAFRQRIFASQKAMVWPSATSKMLSPKTCQNVLESIFAFCQIGVCHVVSLTKESTFQQKQLCQIGLRPALPYFTDYKTHFFLRKIGSKIQMHLILEINIKMSSV